MVRCYGVVQNGILTCSQNISGAADDVILCQGDMNLCKHCEHIRFPETSRFSREQRSTRPRGTISTNTATPAHDDTTHQMPHDGWLTLAQLSNMDATNIPDKFCDSLDALFQYGCHDIQDTLSGFEMDTLI